MSSVYFKFELSIRGQMWVILTVAPFRWRLFWRLRTKSTTPTSLFAVGPFDLIWWHRSAMRGTTA